MSQYIILCLYFIIMRSCYFRVYQRMINGLGLECKSSLWPSHDPKRIWVFFRKKNPWSSAKEIQSAFILDGAVNAVGDFITLAYLEFNPFCM